MESNILLPIIYGKHTFFTEGHVIPRINNQQYELNIGIGYRYLVNANNLLGVYSFFYHNVTQFGNGFNQVTVGGEWFHGLWEGHSNIYVPLSEEHVVFVQGLVVHWKNMNNGVKEGRLYVTQVKETFLYGFDMIGGFHIKSIYLRLGGFTFGRNNYNSVICSNSKLYMEHCGRICTSRIFFYIFIR